MKEDEIIRSISREAPVLIAGPTASGKSALATALAARDGRVIVNADALQVYANWRVLTARPSAAEEAALPHALYGHVGREDLYSVGHWLRDVAPLLSRPVVIVGGTGLYLSALTEGLAEIPPVPPEVRAEADQRRLSGGMAGMLDDLDPRTRARIDVLNPMRVQRAWEVWRATGRGLADWQDDTGPPLLSLDGCEALVLRPEVAWLNARIETRFRHMITMGAMEEVAAERPFWDPTRPSSRAIGAAELMALLEGRLATEQAIAAAVIATRQYAKRQRTWFRARMTAWHPIEPD